MSDLQPGWDYAAAGITDLEKAVRRARITFDGGTQQRAKAREELNALPASTTSLRTYIDDQAAAQGGVWADLKAEKDALVAAFQTLVSEMDARIAADDAA